MTVSRLHSHIVNRIAAFVLLPVLAFSLSGLQAHANEYTEAGYYYAADIDGYYLNDSQKQEVINNVKYVLQNLPLTGDARTDTVIIYNYVRDHVSYDYARPLNVLSASAYGAIYGTAVCEGYASYFLNLCTQAGIDCHLYTSNAENHAWNIVYIEGQAYVCDTTWDSCINKGTDRNSYCLIDPSSYAPIQQADAHDACVIYKTGTRSYVYLRDISDKHQD